MTNKILSYSGNRSLKNLFFHFIIEKRAAFHRAFRALASLQPYRDDRYVCGHTVPIQVCVCSSTGQIKYSPDASSSHWTLQRK